MLSVTRGSPYAYEIPAPNNRDRNTQKSGGVQTPVVPIVTRSTESVLERTESDSRQDAARKSVARKRQRQ
jgi:hypothetical protein